MPERTVTRIRDPGQILHFHCCPCCTHAGTDPTLEARHQTALQHGEVSVNVNNEADTSCKHTAELKITANVWPSDCSPDYSVDRAKSENTNQHILSNLDKTTGCMANLQTGTSIKTKIKPKNRRLRKKGQGAEIITDLCLKTILNTETFVCF